MAFDVDKAVDEQIIEEGLYSDDPVDTGGKTKFGVTEAVARAYGYEGEMKDMPRSVAVAIFKERYWDAPNFDTVCDHSEKIAKKLFEIGINMGQSRAGGFLQRALNVLNREANDYPDIAVDGAIGKVTIHCLKVFLAKRGAKGETVLLRMLNAQQTVRYMGIAEANKSQEKFVNGWVGERVDGEFE